MIPIYTALIMIGISFAFGCVFFASIYNIWLTRKNSRPFRMKPQEENQEIDSSIPMPAAQPPKMMVQEKPS